MTPEERAFKALCLAPPYCGRRGGDHDYECCFGHGPVREVVAAIRAAEHAAYEKAAQHAEDCIANGVVILSAGEVANAIRALKSTAGDPRASPPSAR